jgi:phosphate transport system permease protein
LAITDTTTSKPAKRAISGARLRDIRETLMRWFITANGALAMVIVLLILAFLLRNGLPVFKSVSLKDFVLGRSWYPLSGEFGILPLIYSSLLVTGVAIIIALPLGVACAVYMAEIAPLRVREALKPTVEALAGIPSIVVGFIGLVVVAPAMQNWLHLDTGLTALTGAIMLAFMALPTIISISEDAIVAVPRDYRNASLALGATEWQTISQILVPAAKSGITAAVMLGIGRAIGETMAVLMVTGNAVPQNLGILGLKTALLSPVRTLTATIAAEMGETVQGSPHFFSLFAIGLTLFAITFVVNLIADISLRRSQR